MITIKSGITLNFLMIVEINRPPNKTAMTILAIAAILFPLEMPSAQNKRTTPELTPLINDVLLLTFKYPIMPPTILMIPNNPTTITLTLNFNSSGYNLEMNLIKNTKYKSNLLFSK